MVVTNSAKNRIRDLIRDDISSMAIGTTGTDATASDTDLGSTIEASRKVPTTTIGNKIITVSHELDSITANGETIKEGGVYMDNDNILLDRFVFPDIVKNESITLTTIDVLRVD